MKKNYDAPKAQMLNIAREDLLSMALGDSSQNSAVEYDIGYLFR